MTTTTRKSKSPGRFLESADRGGRYYDLFKVYDSKGPFMEASTFRRYSLRKVYRSTRVSERENR